MEIRDAKAGDAAAIRSLVREAYEVYVPRIRREPAPMSADYDALVAAGEVSVATEEGRIIGVLVLRPQTDALLIENVAVAPAAQSRGVGRSLMALAEQRARELGLAKVTLYTHERMTENLRFYPALGYVEIERRHENGFDRVFFEKPV